MTVVSITHGDDLDGLTCGALLTKLFNAEVILANYDTIEDALKSVPESTDQLYITDINLRDALICHLNKIAEKTKIIIIDHHPMTQTFKVEMREKGVEVMHDTRDCASALVYNIFRSRLEHDAARIAAYAAISDMFEDGPIASIILDHMDRKFVQHEAFILTHALGCEQSSEFKYQVIKDLSVYAYPHRIKNANELAYKQLEKIVKIKDIIPIKAIKLGRLAYMECNDDLSTGEVANIIMDTLGLDVGLCYKISDGMANISLRGERRLIEHLGEIAFKLADNCGGFGGGHNRAAGAKIPENTLKQFIQDLSEELKPWVPFP
ncbi:hypothetical protein FJY84_03690 [Candidatus Bathyarchaeota archaeon]|nr:hypothetical protein [Candidatus Bathyarchaeota archaeon]